jgi:hypothetical protein
VAAFRCQGLTRQKRPHPSSRASERMSPKLATRCPVRRINGAPDVSFGRAWRRSSIDIRRARSVHPDRAQIGRYVPATRAPILLDGPVQLRLWHAD